MICVRYKTIRNGSENTFYSSDLLIAPIDKFKLHLILSKVTFHDVYLMC